MRTWTDAIQIGVGVEGVKLTNNGPAAAKYGPEATIVNVGMRDAGKTYIGRIAATLGWRFVDADGSFEACTGGFVSQFARSKGWPAFLSMATKLIQNQITENPKQTIISTGGGVIKSAGNRAMLSDYGRAVGPVVYVTHNINEILGYLGSEPARPGYGKEVVDVYWRRELWFREVSTYEYISHTGGLHAANGATPCEIAKACRDETARFVYQITGVKPNLAGALKRGERVGDYLGPTPSGGRSGAWRGTTWS